MKYIGSKRRIAKYILPIILADHPDGATFYDLFTGGGNLIDKVPPHIRRVASDLNPYVIAALELIRDNPESLPRDSNEFSKQDYLDIKNGVRVVSPGLYGYVAIAYSFGAKWWGGWRRPYSRSPDSVRGARTSALKQSPRLQGVEFEARAYDSVALRPSSTIYLDPPYKSTTKYNGVGAFDHTAFWQWCRITAQAGHRVFISEYNAPPDFRYVWSRPRNVGVSKIPDTVDAIIERLFVYDPPARLRGLRRNLQAFISSRPGRSPGA